MRKEREHHKEHQRSSPYLHPPGGRSSWVEVFWRNGEHPTKLVFFCFFPFFFCIATQWARPLQPRKEKLSLGWRALVRVHPFVSIGLGMFSGSVTPPPHKRCSFPLTRWTLSGDHVRYTFSWLWKYPPVHPTPSLWTRGETESSTSFKESFHFLSIHYTRLM